MADRLTSSETIPPRDPRLFGGAAQFRAPADLAPYQQAVYDHYLPLVDEQLEYHLARIRKQRRSRRRRPKESDYCENIASETADEIMDCRQRLVLGLATGVERLRKMETLPEDIEAYLRDEIRSQGSDHRREDQFDIIPPASTNSTRPKHDKYKPLKRQPNTIELANGDEFDILEVRSEAAPYMNSAQEEQHDAFRGVNHTQEIVSLKDELARTPEECKILDHVEQGEPRRKIALDLDVTEHRVRVKIELFKERSS